MSTNISSAWIAAIRSHWQQSEECCDRCRPLGRLWRRLRSPNGGIRLHGRSYCAMQCFQDAARERFAEILRASSTPTTVRHRIPLGLLMLARGQLSDLQLRSALDAQQMDGHRRLGEWLVELGYATEQQVTAALGLQWSCPVLGGVPDPEVSCTAMLPLPVLVNFRMLPLQFVEPTRTLYVAFDNGVDYAVLYAIGQMLDCRTEACLICRSAMDRALERLNQHRRPADRHFREWYDPADMARIVSGYALNLASEEIRIVGCRDHIWARLEGHREVTNLVFQRCSEECLAAGPNSCAVQLAG